ncbi:MAG: transposase [Akkermansiaceae bacterium]|nr:transposase [Akkermansiaceae bacterium]MDP4897501.1 transposase [Akkermansiaceae bacterium]
MAPWAGSEEKPTIYHCISRVVDRRFVFGDEEREVFRMFMRMYENFSGCRVLSYCVMSNHFHLLLEVTPVPDSGISDEVLLERLMALYSEKHVEGVRVELSAAREEERKMTADNLDKKGDILLRSEEIRAPYLKRMHNLSLFMKGLIQRFTRWFNRKHERTGTLWEDRFKSVIVESGTAARTMAAYIDLNPVRAGMVSEPAEYRWSSYGEAVGGGQKGNGKKAREGLVRACMSHRGYGFDAECWKEVSRIYRRAMGLALGRKTSNFKSQTSRKTGISKNEAEVLESEDNETVLPDLDLAAMLRQRIRYFTDGAIIGSKGFVNDAFAASRERFSDKRKDGARRMRGAASAAKDHLWSARDLRVGV